MTPRAARTLNGRHVLALVVGFFVAIMAVNAVMVWYALKSFPGMVSADAYREGLAYNRTIEAREAQRALGWQVAVDVSARAGMHRIEARFADRTGTALRGLDVTARIVRPVARGADRAIVLRETSPGEYIADADLPTRGHWHLELEAHGGSQTWRMERDLWLK